MWLSSSPSFFVVCMVKNEELVIGNMLQSVLPYASHILLCDTGSTDKTIQVAQGIVPASKLYIEKQEPFVNFEHNRNRCIAHAKELIKEGEDTYILLLDADHKLVKQHDISALPLYDINVISIRGCGLTNQSPLFIRASVFHTCVYQLWTHEIIICNGTIGTYEGFHLSENPSPDKNYTSKFVRDVDLLSKWLNTSSTTSDFTSRARYYLAYSYEAINMTRLALEMYQKHEAEETLTNYIFYSRYRQAMCHLTLKSSQQAIEGAFLHALEAYDGYFRHEPYAQLAKYWIGKKNWTRALMYVTAGINVPSMDRSRMPLFVEPVWPLYEQYAYILYQFGRLDESIAMYEKTLSMMVDDSKRDFVIKAKEAVKSVKKNTKSD